MALNTVTLKWNVTDLIQSGLAATLFITPTAQMADAADHIEIPAVPQQVTFYGTGQLPGIVANDDAQILPAGTGYLISVVAASGRVIIPQFQTQILFANGAIQWLDALAPVPVVTTGFQYLPLPSGTPGSGQVPVATGAGEASAWGTLAGSGTVTSVTAGDASVVVSGTPAVAPVLATGTLDQVANLHPPAANWSNNSKKITSVANGTGAQDAAAFGQLPVADATAANIQPDGAQAAGAIGKWADSGHIHPAAGQWLPSDNGLLAASGPLDAATGTVTLVAGTLYLTKIPVRAPGTWSSVWWALNANGAGASTGTFSGLYSSSGTLLSGSADIASQLTSGATKGAQCALTTPQALTAGSFVWAALLVNLATTQPALYRGPGQNGGVMNMGLVAATFRFAVNGTGLTSLPGSITPASNQSGASGAFALWAGVS